MIPSGRVKYMLKKVVDGTPPGEGMGSIGGELTDEKWDDMDNEQEENNLHESESGTINVVDDVAEHEYLNKIVSKYQCGFRKGFSTQYCLVAMIEKWRQSLDSGGQAPAFLTDLLKAFDCIDHELLIAKLNTYGFDNSSLSHLSEREQRAKINSTFS